VTLARQLDVFACGYLAARYVPRILFGNGCIISHPNAANGLTSEGLPAETLDRAAGGGNPNSPSNACARCLSVDNGMTAGCD
jgi:hypothetical protein